MAEKQGFSESELEVMKVVWNKKSATAREIYNELSDKQGWHYKTVFTFIARLYKKGYLKRAKKDKGYVYNTAHPREHTVKKMVNSFVDKVFNGEVAPLVNCLSESKKLSADEITALKKIIKSSEKTGR